jgi:hypothetical protein
MVDLSILCFVYFLIPLRIFAFLGVINFSISGFFFKRLNIFYIYSTLILEAASSPGIPITTINYPDLKNLSPYGTRYN